MHKSPIAVADQLAGRLRELREHRRVSQDVLARASGVSRPTLAAMERGASNPRLSNLEQLAKALNVDVLDLLLCRPTSEQRPAKDESSARIAKNVNRLRVGLALSQESLSIASGHFRTYVGNLEHQRVNPSIGDLERIAKVLGVDVTRLLSPLTESDAERDMQKMVRRARSVSSAGSDQ
ncbi:MULTISPECIES: helix-turn-helix domain-containing protein [Paraburkholderia]|uniref:Helix-turn-helix domain-containing protein n=1 Tax=Paraburkholderia podalyriae TaxID=1938811 RepID=A0ABR7PQQ3_9BURK|nr:helix-turn-helix transcriptional regulator [Paraburkholderia podalyriae]MBC8748585.1 helix-turn-helix domain-containing protein [Paraburkholderia podalyriae]